MLGLHRRVLVREVDIKMFGFVIDEMRAKNLITWTLNTVRSGGVSEKRIPCSKARAQIATGK